MPRFDDTKLVTAAAAGATAWAGTRYGLTSMIPGVGPVTAPIATVILGVILAAGGFGSGTIGNVVEGVGYGLVTIGALELAG